MHTVLFLAACHTSGEPEPLTQNKTGLRCYRFETYYKDTARLNMFDLWIQTNGSAVMMYSDSNMQMPAYRGNYLRHDTIRLEFIPRPIVAYGILNDSACEIRYMDFVHKGRRL